MTDDGSPARSGRSEQPEGAEQPEQVQQPEGARRSGPPPAGPDLVGLLRAGAARDPHGIAVSTRGSAAWQSMTRTELLAAALNAAARLTARDRPPGPVIVLVDNTPTCVATMLGLFIAGVDTLLVERENSHLGEAGSVIHRLPLAGLVGPSDVAPVPGLDRRTFDELVHEPAPAGPPPPPLNPATAVLQLTSGSTGEPRIARQTLANTLTGGALYRDIHRITPADTVLAMVPLAHSFGLVGALATALVSGAGLRTMSRFRPGAALEALDAGSTVLLGTPLVYQLLTPVLPRTGTRGRVRVALSSGGPLAGTAARAAGDRLGVTVHQVYGSTETGLIACGYDRDEPWSEESAGAMAPGVDWRLRTGPAQTSRYGRGQLLVRTSTMFEGYADGGAPPPAEDGYLACGDLTEIGEDGEILVVGRKDAFVNVGGRKVSPRRVEKAVSEHPGVSEVLVFGAPGRAGEEEVHAALVLRPGHDSADVLTFCRTRLMPYEVPHRVHVLTALPRTGMGKIDRHRLRETAAMRNGENR
ncbi:fatty acid--CoA ligase family protein [Streptomyces sp. NPDC020875]|uniref:class I adenylate-forming enzyme family protein n=1 Tax=Streptomyces sp. NPDC020875 TaxID=3154898 RepID=UPI0033FA3726